MKENNEKNVNPINDSINEIFNILKTEGLKMFSSQVNSYNTHDDSVKKRKYKLTKIGDVFKDNGLYHLDIPLPGLSKEQVKVSVDSDTRILIIENEINEWNKSNSLKLRLPISADIGKIGSTMVNGLLNITIPMSEKPEERVININIK